MTRRYALILALATTACGGGETLDAVPDAAVQDAATPPACPAQDGEGTRHEGAITADERWAAEDGPHRVVGPLHITGGATVAIAPCAEVRLAPGATVQIGLPDGVEVGHLTALGEADRPIHFGREGADAWGALVAHAPSDVRLAHATLAGGGGDPFVDDATLVGLGGGTTPAAPVLHVDHVAILDSAGPGVILGRAGRFGDGADALTVRGAGTWPLVLGLHALDGLPPGEYGHNGEDAIALRDDNANDRQGLQADATLRDRGVPYVVGALDGDRLYVGANGEGGAATLTIEAGVELRFQREGGLRVVADADEPRGRLVVAGTALAPVVLTSAGAREKGAWSGLYFEAPMRDNRVEHARIEWAGGPCGCQLTSCSPIATYDAAIVLDGRPGEAFLHASTIAHSAGHGVLRSWLDAQDLDFTEGNTFEDVAGCQQTSPEVSDTACPDAAFACQQ